MAVDPGQMRWIGSLREQVMYLQSLSVEQFRSWLADALDGLPRPIDPGNEEFYEYLNSVFDELPRSLQERVKWGLGVLIRGFKISSREYAYLYRLIYLAGKLRVSESYEQLLLWTYDGLLKGVFAPEFNRRLNRDLHLLCLMTLARQALNNDSTLLKICLRDIVEGEPKFDYFAICYRILYSSFDGSPHYLTRYFGQYLDLCMDGEISFYRSFYFMYSQPHARQHLVNNLETLLADVGEGRRLFFGRAVAREVFRDYPDPVGTALKFLEYSGWLDERSTINLNRISNYDRFLKNLLRQVPLVEEVKEAA